MDFITETIHTTLAIFGPYPFLRALVIIVIFIVLGKLTSWIINYVLSQITSRTKSNIDNEILGFLKTPVFFTFLLIGLSLAIIELELKTDITILTAKILRTLGILVWFNFGLKSVKLFIDTLEKDEKRFEFITQVTKPLLVNSTTLLLVVALAYIFLLVWNINVTAFLASAGILGLALGFAAKDTLANVFGGITIFADKPFKVGDFVHLTSGERGVIADIGIRSTRLLTRDDIEITVPNGMLVTTKIINESSGPFEKLRIRVKVGVAFGSDIDKVEKVLVEVAENHKNICEMPEPRVRFRAFGVSSLVYELLSWVERPVLRGKVLHEIHREVYKAFERENIEIPFPQQVTHFKYLPAEKSD